MEDTGNWYTLISLGSWTIQDKTPGVSKCKHFMINTPHRDALLLLQEVFIIGRSFVQEEDEFGTLAC